MANIDARFGLRPSGHLNGMPWNGATMKCYCHASYATALYIGDPVDLQTETDYQDTTAEHMSIVKSTLADGNYTMGAITGFDPDPDNLTYQYKPASTTRLAHVCVDPQVIYQVRDDGTTLLTKLVPGQNGILIETHTGSTVHGLSGMELDTNATAPSADASNMLLIMNLSRIPGNTLAKRAIWDVMISMHRFAGYAAGILGVTAT